MTTKKTCLVFGAGVSASYGFPTGRALLVELCRMMGTGTDIGNALMSADFQPLEIEKFRAELVASHAESVDRFVANRVEFERIGKYAIAAALKPKERPEQLTPDDAPRIYEYIWHRIGRDLETLNSNNLSFVTFNYDRSLEYFLLAAMKANFGLSNDACDVLLRTRLRVAHVYGQLGPAGLARIDRVPYSPKLDDGWLHIAAEGIHLVRDEDVQTDNIRAAQDLIADAAHVCILGFGFDKWNVKRLGLSRRMNIEAVAATALHLTEGERKAVSRLFDGLGGVHLAHPNIDAFALLREKVDILT